jgi:hypothetical protein
MQHLRVLGLEPRGFAASQDQDGKALLGHFSLRRVSVYEFVFAHQLYTLGRARQGRGWERQKAEGKRQKAKG